MIDISKGRYWDEGVKIVSGCTRCSDGCKNCWSLAMEYRFAGTHDKYGNIKALPTHEVKCHPDRLKRFNTRKPKVFSIWNDLFHEDVPVEFVTQVYIEGSINPQNTFLILTKRPERMASITATFPRVPDNIYNGLTVCNQQEADEKIPIFLQVPGKKFLSIEPMSGPINFVKSVDPMKWGGMTHYNILSGKMYNPITKKTESHSYSDSIDAVILGGETGHGARPLHPDWVRSIRNQCASAGVPFFFKQWGEYVPIQNIINENRLFNIVKTQISVGIDGCFTKEYRSDCASMYKVGRNKAGRELDGRTHDDLPWVKP